SSTINDYTYNPKYEGTFQFWLNKFKYVADILEVPDDKIVEFFNNMVDQNIHTTVKQTFPFVSFSELPYEGVVIHYLRNFSSHEVDLHLKRFTCRNQYEKETIENYADSIRKLFYKCIDTNDYEERLCERLINGLREHDIKID
ncbi:hypothetical protein M0804_014889, partial [Polistes exclamans]